MTNSGKTKFEDDLRVYFPELEEIYQLSKDDKQILTLIRALVSMKLNQSYGKVCITYQKGVINVVDVTTRLR